MNELPTTYKDHGLEFTLVKRQGQVAMFQATRKSGWKEFEVFIVKPRKALIAPSGIFVPKRETPPQNSEFGSLAWHCVSRDQAEDRFAKALDKVANAQAVAQKALNRPLQPENRVTTAETGSDRS